MTCFSVRYPLLPLCHCIVGPMDVLSEVLKAVKLDGALFYNAEFSAPWCFRQPASHIMAPYLSPSSKHVIIFHLLTEGRGYTQFDGDPPQRSGHRDLPARRSPHYGKRVARQAAG